MRGRRGEIVLLKHISRVSDYAFFNCTGLESVYIFCHLTQIQMEVTIKFHVEQLKIMLFTDVII